ncbi:Peroxisomal biogenesis factor 3 [Hordeum vulgare]|nr:Peroxisomal biogenesis factor 3 [Hordeum vulgare]
MTIGEVRAHYKDMVREERSREAQANAAYNHYLLGAGITVAPDADLAKQEALLESYRSAHEICISRWRYRQWVVEVAAAAKHDEEEE